MTRLAWSGLALLLCGSSVSCTEHSTAAEWSLNRATAAAPDLRGGAMIRVALACDVSSRTASMGDAWHGTVSEFVWSGHEGLIPPGTEVSGVVTAVRQGSADQPALLELGLRTIRVNGEALAIDARASSATAEVAGATSHGDSAAGAPVVLSDVSIVTFAIAPEATIR